VRLFTAVLDALVAGAALAAFPPDAHERDVCRSYGLGSNSYVTKPVGGTALRSLVAQIPSYWFGVDTPPRVEVKR
jgi:hypothetical protein